MRAWLLVLLGLAACEKAAPAPEVLYANPHREAARHVLEEHCGTCHRSDQPTALPAALKVYALDEPDWSARMSDLQLADAADRLDGNGQKTAGDVLRAFTALEVAHRAQRR